MPVSRSPPRNQPKIDDCLNRKRKNSETTPTEPAVKATRRSSEDATPAETVVYASEESPTNPTMADNYNSQMNQILQGIQTLQQQQQLTNNSIQQTNKSIQTVQHHSVTLWNPK